MIRGRTGSGALTLSVGYELGPLVSSAGEIVSGRTKFRLDWLIAGKVVATCNEY